MSEHSAKRVKVHVTLKNCVFAGESLWAESVGPDQYRIANIPFFAYAIHLGDVVEVERMDGLLEVRRVVARSGSETYRFLLDETDEKAAVAFTLPRLREMGFKLERARGGHFAGSIEASRREEVIKALDAMSERSELIYEISTSDSDTDFSPPAED